MEHVTRGGSDRGEIEADTGELGKPQGKGKGEGAEFALGEDRTLEVVRKWIIFGLVAHCVVVLL